LSLITITRIRGLDAFSEPPHRDGGRHVGFGRDEFVGCSFARGLGPTGATGHGLPFVVRVVLQGDVWVSHLGEIGLILLTPILSRLLTLALVFDFTGGRHGGLLVDRLRFVLDT
jgi:hypothetical protein